MGNDIDDALALALIHELQHRRVCKLAAVVLTHPDPRASRLVRMLNAYYGFPDIPIGENPDAPWSHESTFLDIVNEPKWEQYEKRGNPLGKTEYAGAVELLRSTLAVATDQSVVIIQIGFFSNLSKLLSSDPDASSPLGGMELVRRKVRFLSAMGGCFSMQNVHPAFVEFNIKHDIAAARHVASRWPTQIIWSGYEVGKAICLPYQVIEDNFGSDEPHPVVDAYRMYEPEPRHERPCWDLTSVWEVVFPSRFFGYSGAGTVVVKEDGRTHHQKNPDGSQRFLTVTPLQVNTLRAAFSDVLGGKRVRAWDNPEGVPIFPT